MPGKAPSLTSESLWQIPQACTLIRTEPAPGSGIGRSTTSKGPFARETCTTRIVAMGSSSCLLSSGLTRSGAGACPATRKPCDELLHDPARAVIQGRQHPHTNVLGHTSVEGLGNRARDTGHRVRVPAERDRVADGVFVAVRLQEGDDRLRH